MNASGARRPRIVVTLGDPRGIGGEVTRKALETLGEDFAADIVLVGSAPDSFEGLHADSSSVGQWPGGTDDDAGRAAGSAIGAAVRLIRDGGADALVTAPIDKAAARKAGWTHPGHTEMLATLTESETVGMLMNSERTALGGPLRVLLATTHIPLREVPQSLTYGGLVRQVVLLEASLHDDWGIPSPRIALCALNPHASDGGLFGDEEAEVLEPVVSTCRGKGIDISGPIPADTVFLRAVRGEFDAVVSPYHDVGMAAFKTVSFGGGVNVTLGLPFPRTSPDHGTALDIAGQDRADPGSMVEAIRLAARLTRGFDTPPPAP